MDASGESYGWRNKIREIFGMDSRSLAVFRVGLGVLLICDLIKRSFTLREHYTEDGILPARAVLENEIVLPIFQAYFSVPSPWGQYALFVLAGLLAVALLLGFHTRLVTVVSFVLLLSLQRRNSLVCHTGDTLLTIVLFWAMFLPLGESFSLDRLRRPRVPRRPEPWLTVPTACFLLQLIVFYFSAGALKHQKELWRSGEAVPLFFRLEEYVTPIGAFLADYPGIGRFVTYFTLFAECIVPFLLLIPWQTQRIRLGVVFLLWCFHLGIQLSIYIGILEIISIFAVATLLPTMFWDELLPRVPVPRALARTWSRLGAALTRRYEGRRPLVEGGLRRGATWLGYALAAACLGVVLLSNIERLQGRRTRLPNGLLNRLAAQTFVLQSFTIFTSYDHKFQGWYLALGQLEDGTIVDAWKRTHEVDLTSPENYAGTYPNHNTRRFWLRMSDTRSQWTRPHLARYLARQWHQIHGTRLVRLAIFQIGYYPLLEEEGEQTLPLLNFEFRTASGQVGPPGREAWEEYLRGILADRHVVFVKRDQTSMRGFQFLRE